MRPPAPASVPGHAAAAGAALDAADIQSLVLQPAGLPCVRHLLIGFDDGPQGDPEHPPVPRRHALNRLLQRLPPTPAADCGRGGATAGAAPPLTAHLGFTHRGLQRLDIRQHLLDILREKAPAFCAGAAVRAPRFLGDTGPSAPRHWREGFGHEVLEWVLTLHAAGAAALEEASAGVAHMLDELARGARSADGEGPAPSRLRLQVLDGARLPPPPGEADPQAFYVHFGYRDGLSKVGVRGWSQPPRADAPGLREASWHAPGEFLLGHAQDGGANPWIRRGQGARLRALPPEVAAFFRNASFGVLRDIGQDVDVFETFVGAAAARLPEHLKRQLGPDRQHHAAYVKAKLCGRWPDGRRFVEAPWLQPQGEAQADFDYARDREGQGCPFGAHIRRMNPRDSDIVALRPRPLLRRGLPYGPAAWAAQGAPPRVERGLLGLFFCASIEAQFEHLVGQWADRVPMTLPDRGDAKDPLVGQHEDGHARFEIPLEGGAHVVDEGWRPWTRTRGTAYLYYPGLQALTGIAADELFAPETPADDDEARSAR